MPKFYEVYGADVYDKTPNVVAERRAAYCPFTGTTCDGGGNRHQTKIRLDNSILRDEFDENLQSVIPGVCSIESGADVWIVCPRRLLGFKPSNGPITVNASLKDHEREALIGAGLPRGVDLGVWSEVYLQYGDDDSTINYHFDFVISKIQKNVTFRSALNLHGVVTESDIEEIKLAAKKGGYMIGRFDFNMELSYFPDLTTPFVIEVMTASTSGSDTEAGTNIASSFRDAILGRPHNCPGINKRQVWGRMATQLFAKSALAEYWGGKTIWFVQDQLLKNIERTTKLRLETDTKESDGNVNFISMKYTQSERGIDSLRLSNYFEKSAGISFEGNNKCTDILLPKMQPDKKELLKSVLRRELSAIIRL